MCGPEASAVPSSLWSVRLLKNANSLTDPCFTASANVTSFSADLCFFSVIFSVPSLESVSIGSDFILGVNGAGGTFFDCSLCLDILAETDHFHTLITT